MATLAVQTSLDELREFTSQVRSFPVSVRQLLDLARSIRAHRSVIRFYQTFGEDQIFKDKDDLISRTEQVEILRQESGKMPPEPVLSTEED